MKKFVTAIVSLVLAGTMAFGLAACNNKNGGSNNGGSNNGGDNPGGDNPGGNQQEETLTPEQKWAKMFTDLTELDNYTYTSKMAQKMGITYNGEPVTSETTTGNEMVDAMLPLILQSMGGDDSALNERSEAEKYDFKKGIVERENDEEEPCDYVIVNGATVSEYSWYSDHYTRYEYVGYASKEDALAAVKKIENPFGELLEQEFSGKGEYADVKGNISELYQIFEYDEATGAYTTELDYDMGEMPEDADIVAKAVVKVVNEAVVSVGMEANVSLDLATAMEMGEEAAELFDGFVANAVISMSYSVSDVGTTEITVPADIDEKVTYSYTDHVISGEADYKAMFENLPGNDGTITFTTSDYSDNQSRTVTADYNADLKVLKLSESVYNYSAEGTNTNSAEVYWATAEGMKKFTAVYDRYGNLESWEEGAVEAISGDAEDALVAKLPEAMQLYFNFNGKPMYEQFGMFELVNYTRYEARLTIDGEDYTVRINIGYNNSTGKLEISSFSLEDKNYEGAYVNLRSGDLIGTELPDVQDAAITEQQWKGLVEPWYNLKNVTITNNYEQFLVDIAEDGSSGKVYHTGNNIENEWYILFNKAGETYSLTKYAYKVTSYNWDTNTAEGYWVKSTTEGLTYSEVLEYAELSMLNRLGGEVFWYEDSYKTIGDMWAAVKHNLINNVYELEEEYIKLYFGNNSLVYGDTVLSNKGTTVAGELPAEVAAAQDVKEQYVGAYKDTGADDIVLTLNADGTFTLVGLTEYPTVEGTWNVDLNGNFTMDAESDVWLMVSYYDSYNQTFVIYAGSSTLNLQKVEA